MRQSALNGRSQLRGSFCDAVRHSAPIRASSVGDRSGVRLAISADAASRRSTLQRPMTVSASSCTAGRRADEIGASISESCTLSTRRLLDTHEALKGVVSTQNRMYPFE